LAQGRVLGSKPPLIPPAGLLPVPCLPVWVFVWSMDVITAQQIRTAQQFEQSDRKNDALVNVLKQACSRNRAIEKRQLWQEKDRQDHGSASSISLKSNDGEVHCIQKVPAGAVVTQNGINKYEDERRQNANLKEDVQLNRFCDGQDNAWRPDSFFTEECGQEEVPPWPIRPTELFTNPHLCLRIMAMQMDKSKELKKAKKLKKETEKSAKKKAKKERKKDKKAKKKKKEKKESKGKSQKAAKRMARESDSSTSSPAEARAGSQQASSLERPRSNVHEVSSSSSDQEDEA